ncbi:undecaprenyl-diphosphate phosphatase [Acholeplasma laidlawii]|uniref:undecaprenyl-diphosphate phosphatase n=1 Tax=Acholeplasma laidlawii TaxID=2148 RepID=UPI0018C23B46|nr:undecaprenyl-diphosphate phosphatase [Acholeplasma laidlawii]MBG0762630.1 undecaprenyl-diphosphate phosphatase [Acholeplasma laidlawii]
MEQFIELIKYIVLGIIQGVTEIFPVSSSGHLVLFSNIFLGGEDINTTLTLFLMITNMGSFLALLIYYFKDVKELVVDSLNFVFNKEKRNEIIVQENFNYAVKLIIAIVPIGIAGLLIKDYLPTNLLSIGISLIITSLLLFLVFLLRNKKFSNDITFKNAGVIGLIQMFAVFPGISRSGITLVGGLSQKIEIKKVMRFSFLCYLLISIPVSGLGLYDAIKNPGKIDIPGFSLAFIFSFIFSLLTIKIMHKYVTVKNLVWFSLYALTVGLVSITLYFI